MNIAQINQHQKSQPSKDSQQTEIQPDLLNAFKGQLQFAENDLELIRPLGSEGDDLRTRHQEVEKKRKQEDTEKSVAASYWQNQNLENKFRENQNVKESAFDLQNHKTLEKESARQHAVDNASSTKKLNQEVSKERISQLKPYLLSSALEDGNNEVAGKDFSELLKAKQTVTQQQQSAATNKAAISELPLDADQMKHLPSQEMNRPDRNTNQARTNPDKPSELKINTIQSKNQKPSTTIDFQMKNNDSAANSKAEKGVTAKSDGFSSQLNASVKEGQKTETSSSPQKTASAQPETEPPNVKDVANNVRIMLSAGKDTIVLRLTPEHLGKLEIKLKKAGEALTGEFKVESAEAKKTLLAEFASLQQELENQGVKLNQYTVFVKGEEDGSMSQNSSNNQQQEFSSDRHDNPRKQMQMGAEAALTRRRSQTKSDEGVKIVI